MTYYMLAQVKLKFGAANLERFTKELLPEVQRLMEQGGIRLKHCMVTQVGQLFEMWDLWELGDSTDTARVGELMADPACAPLLAALSEVIESEHTRVLASVPGLTN